MKRSQQRAVRTGHDVQQAAGWEGVLLWLQPQHVTSDASTEVAVNTAPILLHTMNACKPLTGGLLLQQCWLCYEAAPAA